ncbi:epsin-1-like [Acanthaster planci]|uniref:Epsin-1-like n=1 Tax=Acanthaster planci TaxID=133434 RepID=A0A8B7YLV2_ACAPL|nr:epsin-1-like [Acanthaster planci]XP_022093631.1 epsin-1-like [Acanthaster planci]XP_022093632.1 epsin-1-like [Acanthaster planci]
MSTSRKIKNVIKNYNDSQRKVRDATSNDPWGPASSTMSEIADLTYNVVAFTDIMDMIWKRINDKGKNWRHVYKALVLLDYIIKTGSERVAQQCKEKIVDINTLKDFRFYDSNNQDVGRNVREKSKQIVELLKNEERLKSERVAALKAKERFAQANQGIGSNSRTDTFSSSAGTTPAAPSSTPPPTRNLTSEIEQARPQTTNEEELQLQLALAMSKEEAEQERQQQKNERIRLEMAINESLEENSGKLDLSQSPPTNDPWAAAPAAAAPVPQQAAQGDLWTALAAPPPLQAPAPAADPWAPAPPTVQPAADPWGSPATSVPTPAPVPAPVAAPVAVNPQNDPWAVQPSNQPKDPDAEFDLLRSNTAAAPAPPSSNGNLFGSLPVATSQGMTSAGAFDLTGMEDSLPSKLSAAKKPEDFLGENSSLVNLDALVGPPKPAQLMPQAPNPFLGGGVSGGMAAPQSNPFQQQRQPAPTINQMRAEPMMSMSQPGGMYAAGGGAFSGGAAMGGSSLPPPLIPMSSGPSQNQMQPQQANNPFLL